MADSNDPRLYPLHRFPDYSPDWTPVESESVVLRNPAFGQLVHACVDSGGYVSHDKPVRQAPRGAVVLPVSTAGSFFLVRNARGPIREDDVVHIKETQMEG